MATTADDAGCLVCGPYNHPPVLAATPWPSNADLIADVHRLGYLRDTDHVLDPTFENGVWWQRWRPAQLTTHHRAKDGSDFRALPYPDATFDAIAFDPPYVCPGGRSTSTIPEMHERYGMAEGGFDDPDFRTPAELQAIIDAGLTEMVRLVRPARTKRQGGIILVKCQNYVWSGELFPGAEFTLRHAWSLGLVLVDRFELLTKPGPQPTVDRSCLHKPRHRRNECPELVEVPRPQQHARRNLSTLFVLRRPKETRPPGWHEQLDFGGDT